MRAAAKESEDALSPSSSLNSTRSTGPGLPLQVALGLRGADAAVLRSSMARFKEVLHGHFDPIVRMAVPRQLRGLLPTRRGKGVTSDRGNTVGAKADGSALVVPVGGSPALSPLMAPSVGGGGPGEAAVVVEDVAVATGSTCPGHRVLSYRGHLALQFIRESESLAADGGFDNFNGRLREVAMMVSRAHARALGGNGVVCWEMQVHSLVANRRRGNAYVMFTIHGDVVLLEAQEE